LALPAAGLCGPRGGGPHAIAGGQRLVIAAVVGAGRAAGFVAIVCQAIGRNRGGIDCVARLALARSTAATATASAATAARPPLFVAVSRRLAVSRFGGAHGLGDQIVAGAAERIVAVTECIAVIAGAAIEWLSVGRGQTLAATLAPGLASIGAAVPAATAAATAAAPTAAATRAVFPFALAAAFCRVAARQGTGCRGFVIPVAAGLSTARFLVASVLDGATFARRHGTILEGSLLAGFHRAAFRGAGFDGPRRGPRWGRGGLARRG
jgi:hypothetical protein